MEGSGLRVTLLYAGVYYEGMVTPPALLKHASHYGSLHPRASVWVSS